jgi:tyrosine-protein kinase Etk/Wzc
MSDRTPYPEDIFVEKNKVNFKLLFSKMLANWYWFFISLVLCLALSFLYLRYTAKAYTTSARILITDDQNKSSEDDLLNKALGGQFGSASSVQGEAEILKTRHLMEKVVQGLKSNISYYHKGQVRSVDLYKDSPFKLIVFAAADSIKPKSLEVTMKGNRIHVVNGGFSKDVNFLEPFTVPGLGKIQIEKGEGKLLKDEVYLLKVSTLRQTVNKYVSNLKVSIPLKDVNIIALDYNSEVPQSAVDILNKLIESYVQANIADKNKIADSTIAFIEDRLLFVGKELGNIEGNVQTFKQKNKVVDITAQSSQLVTSTSDYAAQLAKVETQISVLASIEKYLADSKNNKSVVPSGALLEDPSFAILVDRYNGIVLEKEKSSLRQTEGNPYMQNLNAQIASAKADMLSGLASLKQSLAISKAKITGRSNTIAGQANNVPKVERTYLDLARQQQIKQDLYVYLMTKREETAISKTSNISNCKIIEPPVIFGPVSPVTTNVIGYGFILGLFIPFGFIFAKDMLNGRISSKEEVKAHTQVSIIGEIGKSTDSNEEVVTVQGSRTPISEQFRALRTNLSFFLKGNEKTIMMTSSMSGEGKSFVALNLAMILAISGKKVVVMELDLRKPTVSKKLNLQNDMGFTNYIISEGLSVDEVIKPSGAHENLFVISSGHIPPNPSEIILNNRTDKLIEELQQKFDYVIIDAAPIGMVTDAQLLSKYADLTLYVVRQGFTYKDQLSIPQELYINRKVKEIAILLNDVKDYTNYGYGYGYGLEDTKQGFFSKLFKKS